MKKDEMTFTKIDTSKRYYMVNLSGERMGNYELMKKILGKWEFNSKSDGGGNGNINYECTFDLLRGEIKWNNKVENWREELWLSNILDSPLLLYRLICIFKGTPDIVNDPYKTIWWMSVKHKKTGKFLTFGEWKGATGFWLPETTHTGLKEPFKKDLEELLLFLVSDQIPHPYDGCTAGQVA